MALAVGMAAAETLAWHLRAGQPSASWVLFGLVPLSAACALGLRRWPSIALGVVGLCAGLVVGLLFWGHVAQLSADAARETQSRWRVVVVSEASNGKFGASSEARALADDGRWLGVTAAWPGRSRPPDLGREAVVFGSLATAGNDSRGREAFRDGQVGTLRVRRIESLDWRAGPTGLVGRLRAWALGCVNAVPGPGGDLLAGDLLGSRARLSDTQTDTDMKVAGLAHFEATSGYHLLLVVGLLEWALLAAGLGRKSRGALTLTVVAVFVLLTGARASVVRAACMAVVAGVGWQTGRRTDGISALALCAATLLCAAPSALFDLGFQLSVLGVAGILLYARLGEAWCAAALPKRLRPIAGPIAVTVCAVAATMPLSAPAFGFVSLVAPASNLVAAPLVAASLLIGFGGLAACAVSAPLGALVLHIAGAFSAMLASIASGFARVPYAAVPAAGSGAVVGASVTAAVALWAFWPQPRRFVARVGASVALAAVVVALAPVPSPTGPEICVLDVGQGDAILVSAAGHNLLVDTGPSGQAALGALARHHVTRLDAAVITHLHEDHYGGLKGVASVVRVPVVFVPKGTLAHHYAAIDGVRQDAGVGGVRELGAGDELRVGDIALDVVSPQRPVENAATNEASVVMLARRDGKSVLLTGDAEQQVVQAAVDAGMLRQVDVLKVGHHGSAISVSPTLLSELAPRAAVISVGAGNKYGHPTPTALRLLRDAGVPTYRTDLDGDVTIALGEAIRVRTARRRVVLPLARLARPMAAEFGPAARVYAKLQGAHVASRPTTETDVSNALRPQVRLPHLRGRGPPPGSGAGQAEEARGRRCRPRLQLRHV